MTNSNQVLFTVEEVTAKIAGGQPLLLAGEEQLLTQLPQGNWVGGSIPYFMASQGGLKANDLIYVTEVPSYAVKTEVKVYDEQSLPQIYLDAPENGFTLIIIPASSSVHLSFALNAPNYEGFGTHPLIGWISGTDLEVLGKESAKVVDGRNRGVYEDAAVAMHVELPEGKYADIDIVNIFNQGEGDTITFPADGFSVQTALVNGAEVNFAEYVKQQGIDTRFPLVANYNGSMINISYQSVDEDSGTVNFYAPVFKGVEYKQANKISDYVAEFTQQMPRDVSNMAFSCNCILNYLHSELEGKQTGGVVGPITFGEVAYQLLNQTLAYITINDLD